MSCYLDWIWDPITEITKQQEIQSKWQTFLQDNKSVVQIPKGLPLTQVFEKSMCSRKFVDQWMLDRPYHYPHYKKDKIKNLINEMLEAKIIQPGKSTF